MAITAKCPYCGGKMSKKTICTSGFGDQLIGCGLSMIGIVLCLTGVGAIIGIPLILIAGMLVKTKKVIKCRQCGHYAERA